MERIFAAPTTSPARSAPMAKTPHTSSPEKPERPVPQHRRSAPTMSIIRPYNRRNTARTMTPGPYPHPHSPSALTKHEAPFEIARFLREFR